MTNENNFNKNNALGDRTGLTEATEALSSSSVPCGAKKKEHKINHYLYLSIQNFSFIYCINSFKHYSMLTVLNNIIL